MTPVRENWPPPTPGWTDVWEIAEPRDTLWLLRRNVLGVLAGLLAGAILGGLWIYFSPPAFVSQATVRFLPPQVAGRFVNPNFSMEANQRLFALSQLLNSRLTATKMIQAHDLYPERRQFQTIEDLTGRFQNSLLIQQIGGESAHNGQTVPTLRLAFSYSDPEKARKVVQKLIEQVYEENRKYRGDQSLGTTEFLTEQLQASEDRVLEAEQRLGEIQESVGTTVSQTRLGQNTSRSYVVDSRLRDLRHDRRQQEERKATKRAEWEQLELMQKRIETRPAEFYIPEFESMLSYGNLRERLASSRMRLERLSERYAVTMPDVVSARNEVNELEAMLERFHRERGARLKNRDLEANAAKIALAKLELQALDKEAAEQMREESELRAEAQRLREQQSSPTGQEVELLIARREYDAAREHHLQLLRKQEESKAASELERRGQGETVELIDPPSKPDSTESWPAPWRLALCTLGGGLAALGIGLARALSNPVILHGGQLERWAGLPVLGQLTLVPAAQNKGWRRWLSALSLLAVVFLTGCGVWGDTPAQLVARARLAEQEGRLPLASLEYRQALRRDSRNAEAHAGLARIALRLGELKEARDSLARAVELAPDQHFLLRQLADTSYRIYFGDPGRPTTLLREVEALGEKLRTRWPDSPDGYRILAQVLLERHRAEEAVALLEAATRKLSANETLRAQLAAILPRLGRSEEAETILEELIVDRPSYSEAYDLLYLRWMHTGREADARQLLMDKAKACPGLEPDLQFAAHEDALGRREEARKWLLGRAAKVSSLPLGFAKVGDFWMERGHWDDAWQAYQQGSKAEPKHRDEYAGRMAEWHLARGNPAEAEKVIQQARAITPSSPLLEAYAVSIRLGETPADRRAEARKRLEAILQQMPDSPFVRYHLGRAYLLEKQAQPALEQFEHSVKLDPNYAAGWLALAEMEISRGNLAVAESRAEAVLDRLPRHPKALLLRARAQVRRGKTAQATADLKTVVGQEPENWDAVYTLAVAEANQNRIEEAERLMRKGQASQPLDPRWSLGLAALVNRQSGPQAARDVLAAAAVRGGSAVLASLAAVQIEMRDAEGAYRSYSRLIAESPGQLDYHLGQAGALAMAGKTRDALTAYVDLQKRFPSDARVWLQSGALEEQLGRKAQARAAYEQALKLDPNHPIVLNNLAWLLLEDRSDAQRALTLAQRARQLVRQSMEVDGTLARAYTASAMYRNAEAIYEEMLSYLPQGEKSRIEKLLASLRSDLRKEQKS